ncbi:hypothetical protein MLD38_002820 [Melastoma candidum]|uniref:Uncharacterized protein n=1 Tax=Melastoma candidum TaxID=119954 RepID=A0ACB9S2J4_9MYRT|nr:hypothetical protein MLD38_002820 [Melastoma candidum]
MDALIASYGAGDDDCSDSEGTKLAPFPPPPLSLLSPSGTDDPRPSRVRSFPHVQGNYSLHVYIPVQVRGPPRREIAAVLKRAASVVPGLCVVDIDLPLESLVRDDQRLHQLGIDREFHISLGRCVPIRVHQIDSVVSILRQKLHPPKRYWIEFSEWQVFVNDERTRSFLSLEVTTRGLGEIRKQIEGVNEVYRLHNLPEFYKDPRPHISLAWAAGDARESLNKVVEDNKLRRITYGLSNVPVFGCNFGGVECKIGKKTYKICKPPDS